MKMAPFVLLFLASVGIADGNPAISIDQVESMSDQPISIVASNLIPFQQYTVRAVAQDPVTKANWESFADFYSDSNGKIDLGHAKAISGTYNDIDAMGLFWSMLPVQSQDPTGRVLQHY